MPRYHILEYIPLCPWKFLHTQLLPEFYGCVVFDLLKYCLSDNGSVFVHNPISPRRLLRLNSLRSCHQEPTLGADSHKTSRSYCKSAMGSLSTSIFRNGVVVIIHGTGLCIRINSCFSEVIYYCFLFHIIPHCKFQAW